MVKSGGPEVSGLLDWTLKEFAVLGNILTNISDNSAVISCENAFVLLKHEGCQDLDIVPPASSAANGEHTQTANRTRRTRGDPTRAPAYVVNPTAQMAPTTAPPSARAGRTPRRCSDGSTCIDANTTARQRLLRTRKPNVKEVTEGWRKRRAHCRLGALGRRVRKLGRALPDFCVAGWQKAGSRPRSIDVRVEEARDVLRCGIGRRPRGPRPSSIGAPF